MGISCKQYGKFKGIMRKMTNRVESEEHNTKLKKSVKKEKGER